MPFGKRKKTGFSLIELSVVILIISILAAGAISVSGVFLVNAKNKQTKDKMEVIYKALGNYVAKNYYLPCPASLELDKSSSSYGDEEGDTATTNTARTCSEAGVYKSSDVGNIVYGMVPVTALGLSDDMAVDGFGTRFGYVVNNYLASPNYSNTTGGFSEGFSYYSEIGSQMIQINQATTGNVIQKVAFAIISHGANKYGGFSPNSTTQNSTSGASSEESYNYISNVVTTQADFGQNPDHASLVTFTASDNDDQFDDMVFYKTRDEIIADFNLGFLYFCDNNDTNYTDANYTANFSYAYSGQIVHGDGATTCDNDATMFPSKECGPRGLAWIDKTTCPPVP